MARNNDREFCVFGPPLDVMRSVFYVEIHSSAKFAFKNRDKTEGKTEHRCPICSRPFRYLTTMKRHLKYFCGRKTPRITGYIQMGDDVYQCQGCEKRYKNYYTLRRHIVHECGKEPSIGCPVIDCEYKAKFNSRMTQHCRMVHKLNV